MFRYSGTKYVMNRALTRANRPSIPSRSRRSSRPSWTNTSPSNSRCENLIVNPTGEAAIESTVDGAFPTDQRFRNGCAELSGESDTTQPKTRSRLAIVAPAHFAQSHRAPTSSIDCSAFAKTPSRCTTISSHISSIVVHELLDCSASDSTCTPTRESPPSKR